MVLNQLCCKQCKTWANCREDPEVSQSAWWTDRSWNWAGFADEIWLISSFILGGNEVEQTKQQFYLKAANLLCTVLQKRKTAWILNTYLIPIWFNISSVFGIFLHRASTQLQEYEDDGVDCLYFSALRAPSIESRWSYGRWSFTRPESQLNGRTAKDSSAVLLRGVMKQRFSFGYSRVRPQKWKGKRLCRYRGTEEEHSEHSKHSTCCWTFKTSHSIQCRPRRHHPSSQALMTNCERS